MSEACNVAGAGVELCLVVIAEHLVATTREGDRSLLWPERASWLWGRLRARLEGTLSCVLMPDHLHIVAVPGGEDRLRRVLSAYTARFGVQFDILEPEPANSAAIAKRMIRYGFFNPIRAGLVGDPWSWSWSTLRDLSDAIYPAWTSLPGLAERLGGSTSTLLHSLTTLGEHRPTPPKRGGPLVASMEAVRSAVASALRLQPADVHGRSTSRVLFVQASEAVGHPSVRTLADALGCTERSIRRYRTPQHPALDAALLCLADPRLREP